MMVDDAMEPATMRLVTEEDGNKLLLCSVDMTEVAMEALGSQRVMDALLRRFGAHE